MGYVQKVHVRADLTITEWVLMQRHACHSFPVMYPGVVSEFVFLYVSNHELISSHYS